MESKIMCDYKIAFDLGYKEAKKNFKYEKEHFEYEKENLSLKLKGIQNFLIFNTILLSFNLFIYYFYGSNMDNKFLFLFFLYVFMNINIILNFRRRCRDLELKT